MSDDRRRHAIDVVTHLVAREFRIRYRRSALGWLWAVGQPLARLVVLSFVFTRVLPLDIPNYPVFLFAGLITWTWFASGVQSATSSAVDRGSLLRTPGLPRAALPVVAVLTDGLDYLAALPVMALFLVASTGIPLTVVALPIVLVPQLLLTLGLGFVLCAANVHLRDVRLLVGVAMLLGFYVTPVFYRPAAVPEQWWWVTRLNPMAWLVEAQRQVLVAGHLPDLGELAVVVAASAAACAAGYAVYARAARTFVDEL